MSEATWHRVRALLALAAAMGTPAAHAQPPHLGRLFTTEAERQRLDAQRTGTNASAVPPAPAPETAAPPPPPAPLTVNGVVLRSGGHATVWINQVPQAGAVRLGPDGRTPAVTVTLPGGASVTVKPGQQVDPVTGANQNADQHADQ
jgi:hypothetical protein